MFRKFLFAVGCTAALGIIAGASLVQGHADYDHSHPGANEVLTTPPSEVEVHFSEHLAPGGPNDLTVHDSGNVDVDNNDVVVDEDKMTVTLQPGLGPGKYTVDWVTTSEHDGDTEEGTFQFFIVPAVGGVSRDTALSATPLQSGEGSGSSGAWFVAAGVAIAAIVSLGGGMLYGRRRR